MGVALTDAVSIERVKLIFSFFHEVYDPIKFFFNSFGNGKRQGTKSYDF